MKKNHVIEGVASIKLGELVNVGINLGTEDEQILILNQSEVLDLLAALLRFTAQNYE